MNFLTSICEILQCYEIFFDRQYIILFKQEKVL